jgi:hypothetical protein
MVMVGLPSDALTSAPGPFGRRAICAFILIAHWFSPLRAGEIWDGDGANANWTTGANWNFVGHAQSPPPNNGTANIHFAGNNNVIPNVDVPYSINSLTFDSGAVSFFVVGQELTVGAGGVTNNDNSNQFVSAPVKLAADISMASKSN